jgi:hypothetical protein
VAGNAGRFASDPLCNRLPQIRSETPPLPQQDLDRFLTRMQAELADPAYTALVPAAERPRAGTLEDHADRFPTPPEDPADAVYSFTQAQVEILVEALTRPLLKAAPQKADSPKAKGGRKAQAGRRRRKSA